VVTASDVPAGRYLTVSRLSTSAVTEPTKVSVLVPPIAWPDAVVIVTVAVPAVPVEYR